MPGRDSSFTKGICCAKERIRPCVWYKLVVTEHGCLCFPAGYTFSPVDLAGGNSSHPLVCVLAVSASGMSTLAEQRAKGCLRLERVKEWSGGPPRMIVWAGWASVY